MVRSLTTIASIASSATLTRTIAVVATTTTKTATSSPSSGLLLLRPFSCRCYWGQKKPHLLLGSVLNLQLRGGSSSSDDYQSNENNGSRSMSSSSSSSDTKYIKLADPAPGSPFHYAFPVHDLQAAKDFYGGILGCVEGRSSEKWQDYSLHGHQIVCHYVGPTYRCQDYYNPVDGDNIPVPHMGLALTETQFHNLAKRLNDAGIHFIVPPHLRFKGKPGEQWTMFFKDPSGNNLEFKAMTCIENLFVKYNVVEDDNNDDDDDDNNDDGYEEEKGKK